MLNGPEPYTSLASALDGLEVDLLERDYAAVLGELAADAAGLAQSFHLSHHPVAGSVDLRIEGADGLTLDPEVVGSWRYDPETNYVELLEFPPPHGSTVVVSYVGR